MACDAPTPPCNSSAMAPSAELTARMAECAEAKQRLDDLHAASNAARERYDALLAGLSGPAETLARADEESELRRANRAADDSLDAWTDILDAVVTCPVFTMQDLARKIAFINDNKQWGYETTHKAVSEDVARIAEGR